MKKCPCCSTTKEHTYFYKNRSRKDGLSAYCKECTNASINKNVEQVKVNKKKWKDNNKEYHKDYYKANKNKLLSKNKEYKQLNKEKRRPTAAKYEKDRRHSDPLYKLVGNIRHRIRQSLKSKNFKKNKRFVDYIGCTIEELAKHLESQFKPGMNWDNYGEWHIDHIIPLAIATSSDDVYKLNHYTNLQPLPGRENCSKGKKL